MSRDFTLDKYSELCKALKSHYKTKPVWEFLAEKESITGEHVVILRHDVDKHPGRSLEMAQLENALGICSTYYFRMMPDIFKPEIVKAIEDLGHEIGYHYEVVDKANGDIDEALLIFKKELDEMRETADIKTACMHGSPLKSWKNLDIWNNSNPVDHGLLGEPYLSIDYDRVSYYTDTGRRWDGEKYSIDDHVEQSKHETARTTDDLINIINRKVYPQMLILSHPQRWSGGSAWVKELIGQNVKNVGKKIIKRGRQ